MREEKGKGEEGEGGRGPLKGFISFETQPSKSTFKGAQMQGFAPGQLPETQTFVTRLVWKKKVLG